MSTPLTTIDQAQLDRIEQKLDRLLSIFGEGKLDKLPSEIRREAQAKVLQLRERQRKREGHVRANKE
jgi:hypothetical protein